MPPRRSTRSSSSSEGESQMRANPQQTVGTGRRRARSKKNQDQNGVIDTNEDRARDLLDIIDTSEAQDVSTEQEVHSEGAGGVCDSDEDRLSVSSISSGPSAPRHTSGRTPESSPTLCSVCHKLHQKAKRMKKPMKDKQLDNGEYTRFCRLAAAK